MCRIRRLTGRIAAWPANVLNHYASEIFLNQATFEAGWEHGQLPTFDAATVTGDELVELLLQSDGSHRPAQVRRMSQMIAPRRLTFSSGEILERRIGAGGWHLIRLGMGQRSRGGDFALIWESVARDGNRQVDDLAVGQQLKGISGILTTGDGRNGIPEIVLDDMTFASATQAESLPAFDPKTLTGSDLVRMLSAHKTSLTPSEVRLLQKGLAERELTIDLTILEFLRYLSGAFGDANGIQEFRLSFAQRDRKDAMCMVVSSCSRTHLLMKSQSRQNERIYPTTNCLGRECVLIHAASIAHEQNNKAFSVPEDVQQPRHAFWPAGADLPREDP